MTLRRKLLRTAFNRIPALRRLHKNEDGVAAIEFALVAPIMIAFYFGMSEIALGIMTDRNVSHATSVTADLATQLPTMNAVDLSDVMTATIAVMGVQAEKIGEVTIELNSYQMESDGTINQVGYARLGPQISAGPATYDPAQLNAQMLNAQSGVVVARLNYKYKPVTLMFMSEFTMAETLVMKPRKSISVPFDQNGLTNFTCTAGSDRIANCVAS